MDVCFKGFIKSRKCQIFSLQGYGNRVCGNAAVTSMVFPNMPEEVYSSKFLQLFLRTAYKFVIFILTAIPSDGNDNAAENAIVQVGVEVRTLNYLAVRL